MNRFSPFELLNQHNKTVGKSDAMLDYETMQNNPTLTEISGKIQKRTANAMLFKIEKTSELVWIPLTQVYIVDGNDIGFHVFVTKWFYNKQFTLHR